jgi:hypothetical protein
MAMTPRITVKIDDYLVQNKLSTALQAIVGAAAWRGTEVRVISERRRRWDMVYQGDLGQVAVEFDGDAHYRDSLKIKADFEKDELAKLGGYKVVRIPYWVQLTTDTLAHYFGLEADIIQDFPHGFITTRVFPASFCELGIARFEREMESLPDSVRQAVISSLRSRVLEHGVEYVIPQKLARLL